MNFLKEIKQNSQKTMGPKTYDAVLSVDKPLKWMRTLQGGGGQILVTGRGLEEFACQGVSWFPV